MHVFRLYRDGSVFFKANTVYSVRGLPNAQIAYF